MQFLLVVGAWTSVICVVGGYYSSIWPIYKEMGQINPFIAAIAQTPQALQAASAGRDAQIHRDRLRERASGLTDQSVDEYVEGADAVEAVGDDRQHEEPAGKKKQRPRKSPTDSEADAEEPPHIDVRA
jgi:hypothetical protein